ncbi:hypothetical protein BJ742DRAFT_373415 [Cladochytrium replicatum]|nr:hypothetical protein BJ742DRAFT_373415 [Cladochytrium replicatum]
MEAKRASRFGNNAGRLAGDDELNEANERREADRFQEQKQEQQEETAQITFGMNIRSGKRWIRNAFRHNNPRTSIGGIIHIIVLGTTNSNKSAGRIIFQYVPIQYVCSRYFLFSSLFEDSRNVSYVKHELLHDLLLVLRQPTCHGIRESTRMPPEHPCNGTDTVRATHINLKSVGDPNGSKRAPQNQQLSSKAN